MSLQGNRLRIGVYMVPPVQMLDLSAVDIFASLSREYMDDTPFPEHVKAQGKDVVIKYITPDGPTPGNPFAPLTASAALRVDHSINDAEVQPGAFDILLIPGPPPLMKLEERALDFVRKHFNDGNGAIVMSICTGCHVIAEAGITAGRQVTAPRFELPDFRKKFPSTTWIDKRWARDRSGKLWSSGGITNGQELVAAFCREQWPGAFTEMVLAMAAVGEKGQDYPSSEVSETGWFIWSIIKLWFKGTAKGTAKGKANSSPATGTNTATVASTATATATATTTGAQTTGGATSSKTKKSV